MVDPEEPLEPVEPVEPEEPLALPPMVPVSLELPEGLFCIELVLSLDGLFMPVVSLEVLWCFMCPRPMISIFSARLEAGSKLARTCSPSRIAEMPAVWRPRRSTWVLESTVSVTPPADWSRVMLF